MQRILAITIALVMSFGGVETAFAQADSCNSLQRKIRSYERNSDFRDGQENDAKARAALSEIKKWESEFVRGGCQKVLNAGGRLNSTCRSIARKIQRERKDYSNAVARVKKGSQVAAAREAALQQYARFGCSNRSSGSVSRTEAKPERKTLFERLFGGGDDRINDGDFYDFSVTTYRSVCARTCDGYYWPVSFSTVKDYLYQDAGVCESQAGVGEVSLYYYSNRGGTPDDMVNLNGQRYADSPNAFKYRREYDATCNVKQTEVYGIIQAAEGDDFSRAVISFGDISFPLPRRDPRQTLEIKVAVANYVPLPRPRPNRDGESASVAIPQQTNGDHRVVTIGEKLVRLVGPDTPYAPVAAAGS
ncbi:DUF2865 domain-containing protein [Maritalea porphyrae]|uniref:DUF2865 domain-containing protein n=1 Tax=Maritalea porphyrae TaxID=880732 RepID=UPI0022AF8340|nr:DUF2865 domain-containing protein [Maritalea porphyrae]MCZ4271020.1 DUF2865 domain-containing protein [Maritalea porphyrae]